MSRTITAAMAARFNTKPCATCDELYFTTDGAAFKEERHAIAQSINLTREGRDGTVTVVTRAEAEEFLANPTAAQPATDATSETAPEEVADKSTKKTSKKATKKQAEETPAEPLDGE
jgi:hypothetical protein